MRILLIFINFKRPSDRFSMLILFKLDRLIEVIRVDREYVWVNMCVS